MTDTGMYRKVDDLGRIVLPAELRKTLGLKEGSALDITLEDGCVVLSPRQEACVFCGGNKDLNPFRLKMICATCREEIAGSPSGAPDAWNPVKQA